MHNKNTKLYMSLQGFRFVHQKSDLGTADLYVWLLFKMVHGDSQCTPLGKLYLVAVMESRD